MQSAPNAMRRSMSAAAIGKAKNMRFNQSVEKTLTQAEAPTFYMNPDRYTTCDSVLMENAVQTYYLGEEWDPEHGYAYAWSSNAEVVLEKMQEVEDWTGTAPDMCYITGEY